MGADKGVQSWSIYPPRSYMPTDVPVELLTHIYYVRAVAHLRMNLADGISKAFANVVNGIVGTSRWVSSFSASSRYVMKHMEILGLITRSCMASLVM